MRSQIKKLAAVLLGSSFVGVGLGLAIAQQIGGDGLTTASGTKATGDTDPPPQTSAITTSRDRLAGPRLRQADPLPQPSGIKTRGRAPKAVKAGVASPAGPLLTGVAAETERRMTTYRGTVINTNDKLGLVPLQKRIAAAFARLDPKSPDRSAHFEWVAEQPALNPVGWYGYIVKLEPAPDGGMAEIEFGPIFAPRAKNVTTFDKCIERWVYRAGTLEQVPHPHVHPPLAVGSIIID